GKSIANLVQMEDGEKIASMVAVRDFDDTHHVVMGTKSGTIKKTELSAYSNPRAGGIIAMGIDEGDAVIAVQLSDGETRGETRERLLAAEPDSARRAALESCLPRK
ncbi:MAG: DNA gyrase C-terminal beta-propeller domain-containing protein, partial [Planctomycetota bacterium]